MLHDILSLLETILTPGQSTERPKDAATPPVAVFTISNRARRDSGDPADSLDRKADSSKIAEADEVVAAAARLRNEQPSLTRDVLARLLKKCAKAPAMRSRKLPAVLEASETATVAATRPRGHSGSVQDAEGPAACAHFFALVAEALQLGRQFSMVRLLELQQSARRWS